MTRLTGFVSGSVRFGVVAVAAANGFSIPQARADVFTLCGCTDASNFGVLYEGNGDQLNYNNSNITGNIGIGSVNGTTGSFAGNGPGTITGTIEFNTANTGQFSNSGLTITGGATYGNTNINTDLGLLNSLSQTYSTKPGVSLTISSGGSLSVAAAGTSVYTLQSGSNFPNGTFTITGNGSGTQTVVVNVPFSFSFNGSIVLAGGLTSDDVIFNFDTGNYTSETGGGTLTISTNGLTTVGTYLDPNGAFSINHSLLDGRIFGGDTHNAAFVSGANLNSPGPVSPPPPPPSVPEPASLTLLASALVGLRFIRRRKVG